LINVLPINNNDILAVIDDIKNNVQNEYIKLANIQKKIIDEHGEIVVQRMEIAKEWEDLVAEWKEFTALKQKIIEEHAELLIQRNEIAEMMNKFNRMMYWSNKLKFGKHLKIRFI
jgi:hypothetical protein